MLYKVSEQEIKNLRNEMQEQGKIFLDDISELDFSELSNDFLEDIDNTPNHMSKVFVINKMISEKRVKIITKDGKRILLEN
ncbi:hypothetical protein JCM15765_14840 [Paradesulfitobacterium aromaticivorans]